MCYRLTPLLGILAAFSSALAADPPKHRFLCVDNGNNLLILVDQVDPARSWNVPIPPGSRDIQLLPLGQAPAKVLISHGNGAAEYDLATGKRLEWVVSRYKDVQSAVRLADGQTLLARIDGSIIRLDAGGQEIAITPPPMKMNVRLMRLTESGNALFSAADPRAIIEITLAGKLLRQIPLPPKAKGYVAQQIGKDDRFITSTGDDCRIATIDPQGKILHFVGGKSEHPDLGLDFCSGWEILPDGSYLMANWLGHGKQGKGAHLAQFSPDNKLVWQWQDHKLARQVTNVKMLPAAKP